MCYLTNVRIATIDNECARLATGIRSRVAGASEICVVDIGRGAAGSRN